ncbi:Kelch motif protein [Anatilimnocola aggregata]|uniref:Kelch motif protein n=1 Tax=Anatilimnocola aggregata TaxID=2528021 RepID=A0A517YAS0_9BACT|nr:kelch repeat-containing protein [Anatilimnocola aggregata]QDU27291.1 Kelch motif protein [Anatilimnocola aggregata]
MLHRACSCLLAIAWLLAVVRGPALVAQDQASALPPNQWQEIVAGGVGPRVSPALVWSAARQRFVMVGGTISHAHKPPFPYDVLSLNLATKTWENELPPGGEKWGPLTGAVQPPKFKSPYFEMLDSEQNVRPWQRHAKMWYQGQLAPWDGNLYSLLCGRTVAYHIESRQWRNLEPANAPLPLTKSEKEGLNWSALGLDPLNQELVLFGGGGLATSRGDAGTWVYSTKKNEWRQLDLKVQPPPRALSPLVYDPQSKQLVLFGGDGLDTLYGDTWTYDCATRTWHERKPVVAPAPRLGHALVSLPKSGKLALVGGVGYTSSTAYQALLYKPLPLEIWTYDVSLNAWSLVKRLEEKGPTHFSVDAAVAAVDDQDRLLWWGPKTTGNRYENDSRTWLIQLDVSHSDAAATAKFGVPAGTVVQRDESHDPAWYAADVPTPNLSEQVRFYEELPTNRWTAVAAPKWPMNRQGGGWSTVAYDTSRQQFLHLGGGHSSYFGNDVAHFDTRAARWSISYRPQFALDFNYDLSGPGPWAFNGGPWGNHNYHAYNYDPVRDRLIFIRNEYTHVYDPERRVWPHEELLRNNPFAGSKYTSYLVTTPAGVVIWTNRKESQFASGVWKLSKDGWNELATTGDSLPLPQTDGSTLTFDSERNRLLLTTTLGEKGIVHSGQVWSCDLRSGEVRKLDPAGREAITSKRFARESVFLPKRDAVLFGHHLGEQNRLAIYDVANNRWCVAHVPGSEFFYRPEAGSSVDLGLQYDTARDLVWGVMCKLHPGAVQVMRVSDELKLTPLP